jgi:hypothetical protein
MRVMQIFIPWGLTTMEGRIQASWMFSTVQQGLGLYTILAWRALDSQLQMLVAWLSLLAVSIIVSSFFEEQNLKHMIRFLSSSVL